MPTTAGQLMIEDALPEDMRGKDRELHSKGLKSLFQELADKHPEQYREVTQKLMKVSADAMYSSGGYSFGLRHMLPSRAFSAYRQKLYPQIQAISSNSRLSDQEKSNKIIDLATINRDAVTKAVMDESLAEKNPLALQIHSGTKGKPGNLMSIRGGDLLYQDHRGNTIPFPVLRSYSEGLSPAEYWAGTYGARKGVVDLKTATRDAGYFGKQLTQSTHRLLVTAHDNEDPKYHDPLSPRGLPVSTLDADNEGALLAQDVGPYKRNTVITPKVQSHLHELGHDRVLVRSPTIGGPADGGVYGRDVGIRERGAISPIGDFVGIAAAQAVAEPVSQAQIGCLAADTLVRMADWSVKPIQDIIVGDMVLGADNQAKTFPVTVTHTFKNGVKPLIITEFADDLSLTSTADHKVLAISLDSNLTEQVRAGDMSLYRDCYAVLEKGVLGLWLRQTTIDEAATYDIEVDHPDHLFVLANGLIVSNSKHTGGVAGAGEGVFGFKAINQLVQVPKVFPGGASHSTVDGKVQAIEAAPGGGNRVFINDVPHYVGVELTPKVKVGDTVEAGDQLSDGLPNPAAIVEHKHIGEGRRAFTEAFKRTASEANFNLHRRNIELVARGLINHVRLTEPIGPYTYDDIVPYSSIESEYQPRPGHSVTDPSQAVGKYLERPVLHYTIGTKIRPSVVNELKHFGVKKLTVHPEPPTFQPEMVRGMENLSNDPDWMTRMLGSNLEKGLLKSVHRGGTSNEQGTSYVPSLAKGVDFGKYKPIKGYDMDEIKIGKP